MDNNRWVLDGGTPEEWVAEAKEWFGLRPDQSFQEMRFPIEITEDQERELTEFLPDLQRYIADKSIYYLLKAIETRIDEIGYDENRQLNATGQKLKKLYKELDEQN